MKIQIINMRRIARAVSTAILLVAVALAAGAAFWQPALLVPAVVAGVLLAGDLWARFVQRSHAILRNFGIFGALCYAKEAVGPELRQY